MESYTRREKDTEDRECDPQFLRDYRFIKAHKYSINPGENKQGSVLAVF